METQCPRHQVAASGSQSAKRYPNQSWKDWLRVSQRSRHRGQKGPDAPRFALNESKRQLQGYCEPFHLPSIYWRRWWCVDHFVFGWDFPMSHTPAHVNDTRDHPQRSFLTVSDHAGPPRNHIYVSVCRIPAVSVRHQTDTSIHPHGEPPHKSESRSRSRPSP